MPKGRRSLTATYMRGGTSRGVMFLRDDLPEDRADWEDIFLAIMGSPDQNCRQLDGMGGGISSLSKVCVLGKPSHKDADIDYTFAQVSVNKARVEYAGACGNMSSAVGPFAVQRSLVSVMDEGKVSLVIHDTNTGKLIRTRFIMEGGAPGVKGTVLIDGVAGTGSPVWLDFLYPAGSRTGHLFPTGNRSDTLGVGKASVTATLADIASPCVFLSMKELGLKHPPGPDDMAKNSSLMMRLENLRCEASIRMGITATLEDAAEIKSIPRIGFVYPATSHVTLSGKVLRIDEMDIGLCMISMGDPHRAVPITAALCLAALAQIRETVPNFISTTSRSDLRIGHPSGITQVAADVMECAEGHSVRLASVLRTARRLFEGQVFW